MPRVSIALTSFDGAAFIREQLDSLAAQTRPPDEIVISDDGSADATPEIARAFAAAHPGLAVRLIGNRHARGYNGNFATAFAATTGDVVFPCDQDDVWRSETVERMLGHLAARPDRQLLLHDLEICDGEMMPIGQTKLERIRAFGDAMRYYTVGMSMAVRRPFLEAATAGFAVADEPYDNQIARRASGLGVKAIADDVLADYRRHAANASAGEIFQSTGAASGVLLRMRYFRRRIATLAPGADLLTMQQAQRRFDDWLDASERALLLAGVTETQIAGARRLGAANRAVVDRRLALRRTGRIRRITGVLRLYASGGYDQFSGVRAATKDIVMPRFDG